MHYQNEIELISYYMSGARIFSDTHLRSPWVYIMARLSAELLHKIMRYFLTVMSQPPPTPKCWYMYIHTLYLLFVFYCHLRHIILKRIVVRVKNIPLLDHRIAFCYYIEEDIFKINLIKVLDVYCNRYITSI